MKAYLEANILNEQDRIENLNSQINDLTSRKTLAEGKLKAFQMALAELQKAN
jgi:cell division protein FtsL